MQLEHPVQSPARFIEDVGNAVCAGQAERIDVIGGHIGDSCNSSLQRELICEEHLGGGVARGEEVFQQVSGVMPASAGVEGRAVGKRPIGGATVKLMAIGCQPWIESAALLAHEF